MSRFVRTALPVIILVLAPSALLAQPGTDSKQTVQTASVLDMPIEEIAASTNGCAILDKDFPGLRSHSMYSSFKSMSLNQIAAMSKGQITPAMLVQAQSDLSGMNTTPIAATTVSTQP